MIRFKLVVLFCFCVINFAFSQKSYSVKGVLIDSLTQEPFSFATLSILPQNQSNKVANIIADEKGRFEFSGLKPGKYTLKIDYVGYQTKFIEFGFENANFQINLGNLSLRPNNELLDAVVVSGIKPNVVTTLEKQVFKSEQFVAAQGGTASDLLKNLPSISVNAAGEITMRGSGGFLILIDGKATQVDPMTILSQIAANTIDKVEMITAPSAKYDADGKAGILNIVTKKGLSDGWTFGSNIQYGLPRIKQYDNATEPLRYGIDMSSTYKKGKWDITTAFNYLKNDIAGRRIGDVNTTINNLFTSFPSEGERSFRRDNYGFRTTVQYTSSKTDEWVVGAYFGARDQFRIADIFYNNIKYNTLNNAIVGRSNYFNSNLVLKSGAFNVYNIDYIHRFKDNSSLSISGLYEYALLNGYTKNKNLSLKDYSDTLQYTLNTGENPLNAFRLKLDYEKVIGPGKLSLGYQFRDQVQKGKFDYFEKIGSGSPLIFNPFFSASIEVLNRIHGLYSQYAGSYKKIEFSGGLRYENAYREFNANKGNSSSVLELSNLFPSANLLYNYRDNLRFKMAYSKRVQRSTNNELNPYPEREHSETLEQGDPTIRPEFIGVFETGIAKDFKKGSLYVNLYSQVIDNVVNRVNSVYNDTILNRIYTNAGKANLLGSEFGLTFNPSSKLKIFMGGNVYNLHIKGGLFNNTVVVNSSGNVYSFNSNISFQINPSVSAQFNLTYLSAKNTAQGIDSRFYQPNISLRKAMLSNKLFMTIQWQNTAFGNMKVNEQTISTWGKNFYTYTNYIQERNILMVNFTYNFRSNNKKIKLTNSEFGEREF